MWSLDLILIKRLGIQHIGGFRLNAASGNQCLKFTADNYCDKAGYRDQDQIRATGRTRMFIRMIEAGYMSLLEIMIGLVMRHEFPKWKRRWRRFCKESNLPTPVLKR
ncbi:hypothetical protein HAX54_030741 [Datura stramonium]|uniref:Uncharacterized protein n=1 Tax=Datura stramonium TaxID=4076 RepID=A0ABS8V9C6_DATST|nr:hypothetical protein [Datura stramonium]